VCACRRVDRVIVKGAPQWCQQTQQKCILCSPPHPFLVNFRNDFLNPHRCTERWLWVSGRSVMSRGCMHQRACDPQTQSSVNLVPRVLFADRTVTCPSPLTDIQPACPTLPPFPLYLTLIRFQLVSKIGFN